MRISDWSSDVCSSDLRGSRKEVTKWMIWTIIGGIAFLSCQAYEWTHLYHEGYWWGRIPTEHNVNFSNLFFTITGFHGFHVTTGVRSEEHTSELQSLMRISYAVFCLKNKNK